MTLRNKTVEKARKNHDEMVDAIGIEMNRRANPAGKTGWGIGAIRKYMKWNLNELREGRITRNGVGGFGFRLPSKISENKPAPLPAQVIAFLNSAPGAAESDASSETQSYEFSSVSFMFLFSNSAAHTG